MSSKSRTRETESHVQCGIFNILDGPNEECRLAVIVWSTSLAEYTRYVQCPRRRPPWPCTAGEPNCLKRLTKGNITWNCSFPILITPPRVARLGRWSFVWMQKTSARVPKISKSCNGSFQLPHPSWDCREQFIENLPGTKWCFFIKLNSSLVYWVKPENPPNLGNAVFIVYVKILQRIILQITKTKFPLLRLFLKKVLREGRISLECLEDSSNALFWIFYFLSSFVWIASELTVNRMKFELPINIGTIRGSCWFYCALQHLIMVLPWWMRSFRSKNTASFVGSQEKDSTYRHSA